MEEMNADEALKKLFLAGRMIGYAEAVFAAAPEKLTLGAIADLWLAKGWFWEDFPRAVHTLRSNNIDDFDEGLMKGYCYIVHKIGGAEEKGGDSVNAETNSDQS